MKLSIKARITLWYALLLLVIAAAAVLSVSALSAYSLDRYYRDTLGSATTVILDEMDIEHGVIEIDSDVDEVPNVYASLFDQQGKLIYGRLRVDAPFEADSMRSVEGSGHRWYIQDTLISVPGHERIWLRVHMLADVSFGLLRLSVYLVPLLALVALAGGYLITAQAFRPVRRMTEMADSIAGGDDLSRRIPAGSAGDELHALADTLNAMLGRLQSAFERERRFASDVSHELRTPLNAIQVQGEYALSRESAQEKDEAIARMLQKSGEIRSLIVQLLLIVRTDAGQSPMEDQCDLADMIAEVAEDMQAVAMERDIRIETALEPCAVRGNRMLITRILVNLVDNAIRYGRQGGSVQIALSEESGCAVIDVRDDGCGMTQEELAHAFDHFWRADDSRSTEGTGLGLAIARSAARAHGGSIAAKSEKGRGSRFTVRLPVSGKKA